MTDTTPVRTRRRSLIGGGEPLPRALLWAARGFGFLWVGLLTLIAQWHSPDTRTVTVQIGGYAVTAVALAVWAVLETRAPRLAPASGAILGSLGVVAVVSGIICMTHNGALLVLFACIAALVAGGDATLAASACIAGCGILGVLAGGLIFGGNAAELIGYPISILSALLLGRNRRSYRLQAEQAAQLLERTHELQIQQRRADVLDERARIAREIHDVLAHALGGLGIQIQAARAVLTDTGDIDRALDVLATAQRMASDGLAETRRAVHTLRSDTHSLDQELRRLATLHGGRYGTTVTFAVGGTPYDLPPAAAMTLLRVAQEALINAAKHARDQPVDLTLEYGEDHVRLTAANPIASARTGAAPLQTLDGGYGLTGMAERLLLLGGTLDAGPVGDRWTVTGRLPRTQVGTRE